MKFFLRTTSFTALFAAALMVFAPLVSHAQTMPIEPVQIQDEFAHGNPGYDPHAKGDLAKNSDDVILNQTDPMYDPITRQGFGESALRDTIQKLVFIFLGILLPFMFIAVIAVIVILIVRHNRAHPGSLAPQIPVPLLSYIKQQIAAGFTEDQIRAAVTQGGWDHDIAKSAFDAAYGRAAAPVNVQPMELAAGLGGKYVHSYKKIGAWMVAGPIVGIIAILIIYSLSYFLFSVSGGGGQIIFIFLSFLGIVTLACLAIGIPLGIPFFVRRDADNFAQDLAYARVNPLYKNLTDQEIVYILDWSWAGFFGHFVWPLGEKLYLWALLLLVSCVFPLAPFVLACVMGREGRKMAWEKGWPSFQEFRHRQSIMAWIVGICVIVIPLILLTSFAILITAVAGH